MAKQITEEQLTGGVESLPPAGDERRDVLAARADRLAEQAESLPEGGQIDPKKLRIENELAQHMGADGSFNMMEVSKKSPAHAYAWVNFASQHGLFVKMKLSQGWEVVQGEMEEAIELKSADGTRRLGDVLLMRCQLDIYLRNLRQEDAKRKAQQEGVTANLRELGDRHRKKGVIVHLDESTMSTETINHMANTAAARQSATAMLDKNIRAGSVPGRPAPR